MFIFGGEGGGGGGLQIYLIGYDFGKYLYFYDNASLNPHEYFGAIECYTDLCELT